MVRMRKRKIEEIRRIISSAATMCDLSFLDGVKRKLTAAIRELNELDSEKRQTINNQKSKSTKLENPLGALKAIEEEISNEKEKNKTNSEVELFND
jgi:hypothetical protein